MLLYKNIKARRQALGLSQAELADKVGYSDKSMISHIESGKIDLPQSKIVEFADALKTTPGELLGWDIELNQNNNNGTISNNIGAENSNGTYTTNNYYGKCKTSRPADSSIIFELMDKIRLMNNDQIREVLRYADFIIRD